MNLEIYTKKQTEAAIEERLNKAFMTLYELIEEMKIKLIDMDKIITSNIKKIRK